MTQQEKNLQEVLERLTAPYREKFAVEMVPTPHRVTYIHKVSNGTIRVDMTVVEDKVNVRVFKECELKNVTIPNKVEDIVSNVLKILDEILDYKVQE